MLDVPSPVKPKLELTYDRKVSPVNVWRGGYDLYNARIPNSFGLPAGTSCPGETEFCRSCYGKKCEIRPAVAARLRRNLATLQEAGTEEAMTELLVDMQARLKRTWLAADVPLPIVFRWHWDGDIFSRLYAKAIANTCRADPEIANWVYTRSFRPPVDVIDLIVGIPNLAVYLSVDVWNYEDARRQVAAHPELLVAVCAETFAEARSFWPAAPCPENDGRIPLVGDDGRGACVSCGVCPSGRRDITLTTTHSEGTGVMFPATIGRRP